MKRIAKSTNIHGVKEAWYANRMGRLFYATVFTTCFVLMVFQLKALFQAYLHESVGTKLTKPTTLDHVEVPSFYYCNDMWFPNLQGINEQIRSENDQTGRDQDEKRVLHLKNYYRNHTRYGYINDNYYWRQMRMQDLINDIMILPERGRFDELLQGEGSDDFYIRAYHEMSEMLKRLVGRSLQSGVENNLSGPQAHDKSTPAALINQTHGIFINDFRFSRFENLSSVYELFLKLSNRSGKPLLTLDGICWEFSPGPVRQATKHAEDQIHKHVVTHVGGLGRHITELVRLYLTTPGSLPVSSDRSINKAVATAITKVEKTMMFRHYYATYVSIATQGTPHLLFDQKIRIDLNAPRVLIKYWTKRFVLKARKGWPCRSGWTALDQAHCNQKYARERGDLLCVQYLPASHHFQETNITKETCIHDHTGLLQFGKSATVKQFGAPHAEFPLQISSASRQHILFNHTINSVSCPRACSKTLFQFETTYPTDTIKQKASQCMAALAYFFVPLEDIHWKTEVWWGNQPQHLKDKYSHSRFKAFIFLNAMVWLQKKEKLGGASNPFPWPCSVVEYERSETDGEVSEEYFLYSLSDLAANVGGTVGLWAGASVLSFVQIIYLCCLKKLFKRIEQSTLYSHLTRGRMLPCKGSDSGKSDLDKSGSYNKQTPNRNHVHHV